ncbi:MAG: AAA family ATPase [Pseudomonadales bacterium]|nr:AAA family ATPase [Pseudomonadales bacterium]
MYLEHFGLTRHPFQITPDDDFLYLSQQHARALVYMDYAAWQPDGFVVVTGEIGAGKTTLIKRLIKNFNDKVDCFHIPFTNLNGKELLHYLVMQAMIDIKGDDKISMLLALTKYFNDKVETGKPCVLIVDEAQNLSNENLEDIRMLTGLEGSGGALLRVIIVGQPEFMKKLRQSEQLKQRVKLHFHLQGLEKDSLNEYISCRLRAAGKPDNSLFDADIINTIFDYSHGIPRIINKVCDALLMCAYADNRTELLASDLENIADDLMISTHESETEASQEQNSNSDGINVSDELMERMVFALEQIGKNLAKLPSVSSQPLELVSKLRDEVVNLDRDEELNEIR